jgi:RNA polymerase sigma-70 factor (ECF subfamily)
MPTKDKKAGSGGASILSLVNEARGGSKTAFEQLVGLYHEDIFRMAYYRTRSRMDAEDLTQEIFMRAFKNLRRLKHAARFRGWLYSIALNQVRDFHRKRRFAILNFTFFRQPDSAEQNGESADFPDALIGLEKEEFWKQVGSFLDTLPRMEREVFILRFMDELGIREISEALKKNESTIKTHLYRSLKKFRGEDGLRRFLQESLS